MSYYPIFKFYQATLGNYYDQNVKTRRFRECVCYRAPLVSVQQRAVFSFVSSIPQFQVLSYPGQWWGICIASSSRRCGILQYMFSHFKLSPSFTLFPFPLVALLHAIGHSRNTPPPTHTRDFRHQRGGGKNYCTSIEMDI